MMRIFINCARPDLVDYEAMSDAIKTRGLRVGLDVVPDEPRGKKEIPADLFNLVAPTATGGFLYATPHIAASTDQAQLSIATETVRVIRSFLLEGEVPNVVNVMNLSTARFQMVIRMLDKVGTFAMAANLLLAFAAIRRVLLPGHQQPAQAVEAVQHPLAGAQARARSGIDCV